MESTETAQHGHMVRPMIAQGKQAEPHVINQAVCSEYHKLIDAGEACGAAVLAIIKHNDRYRVAQISIKCPPGHRPAWKRFVVKQWISIAWGDLRSAKFELSTVVATPEEWSAVTIVLDRPLS